MAFKFAFVKPLRLGKDGAAVTDRKMPVNRRCNGLQDGRLGVGFAAVYHEQEGRRTAKFR